MLCAIDHDDIDRPFSRFQLEPELFLHGTKYRWPVRIVRDTIYQRQGPRRKVRRGFEVPQLIRRPFEVEIKRSRECCSIDFDLKWTPDQLRDFKPSADLPPGTLPLVNGVPYDPNGPSIFSAVQEQLGLKLESTKGPVDVVVIDRAEHPTGD